MKFPKATIIIPIYNVQQYMKASVESAMKQTESDIEIILVDDGSTDDSAKLCDEYALIDKRVRVLHKENGSLSSARNAGALSASAPYVLLLDGDDYLHHQAIERLLNVIHKYPSDIVQFRYIEVDEPKELPDLEEIRILAQAHNSTEAFEQLYREGGVYASGCTKLFKRELLLKIPFEVIRHEDEMWCTRAFPYDLTITYIPDVLYGYVMRQGSIIHSNFQQSRLDILRVKEERLKVLQTLGCSELEQMEWNSLFVTLFLLYRDAMKAANSTCCSEISDYLNKNQVGEKVHISGRMKVFQFLSKLNHSLALNCYYFYWKMKG